MMTLNSIVSVTETGAADVYEAEVDTSDGITLYVSRPNDPFGLGPQVRAAVEQWIADGNPVQPAPPPEPEPEPEPG